jgi:hypothetical protein
MLDIALALQRAPGERFRVRERPLPSGVIHLIEVAAGSPQAVQAAASEMGEPEQALIEAARFYLEQVLFADAGADAYRVLGVAPDVPHDTIRIHQRWLQRWLHPDRAIAGDSSVFATRVNQAFAQLRTPELRHDYDVRLAEARLAGVSAPLAPETLRRWEHGDDLAMHGGGGGRSLWLLAAALLSCAVLAVLIMRNPENATPWQPEGDEPDGQATAETHVAPAIEDRDLGILSEALSVAPVSPQAAPEPQAAANLPSAPLPAVSPTEPPAVKPARGVDRTVPPVELQPSPKATRLAETMPTRNPLLAAPDQSVRKKPQAAIAPAVPTVIPVAAAEIAQPNAVRPAPLAPAGAAASPVVGATDPETILKRMRLAEQRVDQVVGYLGARQGAVPMWNDPGVEAQAARLREALNVRSGSLELTGPAWKMRADSASLAAGYRCRPLAKGPCEGRFVVELVWREGLWLVRDVSLAPSA